MTDSIAASLVPAPIVVKARRPKRIGPGHPRVSDGEVAKMLELYLSEGSFLEVSRQFKRNVLTIRKFAKLGNWKALWEARQKELDPHLELDKKGREQRHVQLAKEIISNVRGRLKNGTLKATARDALLAAELERQITGDDTAGGGSGTGGDTYIFMKWVQPGEKKRDPIVVEAVEVEASPGA